MGDGFKILLKHIKTNVRILFEILICNELQNNSACKEQKITHI